MMDHYKNCITKMKEAGFYTIDMGLESGDQEMRFKYLRRYEDNYPRCR